MGFNMIYPLVNVYKKLLKLAMEIVDLPIDSMVIFNSFLYVYQRVTGPSWNMFKSMGRMTSHTYDEKNMFETTIQTKKHRILRSLPIYLPSGNLT